MALHSHPASLSRHPTLNRPLSNNLQASETDQMPTEDGQSMPGSVEHGPSPNCTGTLVSNFDHLTEIGNLALQAQSNAHGHQSLPPGLSNATGEDGPSLTDSPLAANEGPRLPPARVSPVHVPQPSPAASQSANPESLRGKRHRLRRSRHAVATGNEEGPSSPAALPSQDHGRQPSPPALRSAGLEVEGNASRKRKKNNGTAPSSPSVKCRRVNLDVAGPSPGMRRSNRDRRLTAKAAEER